MLTADLVDARKTKDGELLLRPLDGDARVEARAIASTYLELAHAFVGKRREELEEAWEAALSDEQASKRFKLAGGLRKLVEDECTFEAETSVDPVELRRVLFTHASEVRRNPPLPEGEAEVESRPLFDREAVIADAAKLLAIEPDLVERAMFADLRGEHLLRSAPTLDADSVVEAWELGQTQAVLLSAVRVTCEVSSGSAGLVRAFFAKLKFHKLLFSAERTDKGWRVVIDGPYSMFDAVTKYGLRLALAWPAFRALEKWSLVADIKWGKTREPLIFRASSVVDGALVGVDSREEERAHQSDDVRELAAGIEALKAGWRVRPAMVVLDVPGQGVCIPDLELTREEGSPAPIYVEVMGYWSRDAVFKRVELAEKGLAGARVIFAISSRLRVSAEVLDDEKIPSSLYVYKGKMSPRLVLDHAMRIAAKKSVTD
jgi:predicted nuclease of restriction endonuclease-like RecB superfamily